MRAGETSLEILTRPKEGPITQKKGKGGRGTCEGLKFGRGRGGLYQLRKGRFIGQVFSFGSAEKE